MLWVTANHWIVDGYQKPHKPRGWIRELKEEKKSTCEEEALQRIFQGISMINKVWLNLTQFAIERSKKKKVFIK